MKNRGKNGRSSQSGFVVLVEGPFENSVQRPPLGLKPREVHESQVRANRFKEVCGAISRYYNNGSKIPISWVEEYNELVEAVKKREFKHQ